MSWALRHREQAEAAAAGRDTSLPDWQTERFAWEFERALRARGAEYKEAFEAEESRRRAAKDAARRRRDYR